MWKWKLGPAQLARIKMQKVKVRGATNAVDSLARGEEVFTVLDFVTSFSFAAGEHASLPTRRI
jgi:hypothetical protein